MIQAIECQSPAASHWSAEQYQKLVSAGIVLLAEQALQQPGAEAPAETRVLPGFLCARVIAGEWEIENLAVAAEFLRQGIASVLLQALIQHAEDANAKAIFLEVRESNLPARRLYEKHGFTQTARRRAYYTSPLEDAVLYTLHLTIDLSP